MDDLTSLINDILEGQSCMHTGMPITHGLVDEVETYLSSKQLNIKENMPTILKALNPEISLPQEYSSFKRSLQRARKKGAQNNDVISFITPQKSTFIGPFCERYGIETTQLDSEDGLFTPTQPAERNIGLIVELEKYRRQSGHSWNTAQGWMKSLFGTMVHSNSALHGSWKYHFEMATKLRRDKKYTEYAETEYIFPTPAMPPKSVLQEKLSTLPTFTTQNPLLEMAQHTGQAVASYTTKMESKVLRQSNKIQILKHTLSSAEENVKTTQHKLDDSLEENRKLEERADFLEVENEAAKEQLRAMERKYKPKNVMRREETKEKRIKQLTDDLNTTKAGLELTKQELTQEVMANQGLKDKLQKEEKIKRNAQKLASKWKRKSKESNDDNDKINELSEEVKFLENENEILKEQIAGILEEEEVKTFQGGRYSDEVRQVCYQLLQMGVATHKIAPAITTVLNKLGKKSCDRLPSKSSASQMAAECDVLSKMQVGQIILDETCNTLHLDGSRKKFREYSSFQITTGSGEGYSLGIDEMPAGAAVNYMDSTKNLFMEIAELLTENGDPTSTLASLIKTVKNTMTDRHVVNGCYIDQLREYKESLLPKITPLYHSFTAKELQDAIRINKTFCGMHAIVGMGTVSKEALTEFETIAAPDAETRGFKRAGSRTYNLMYEVSKALVPGHNYQKAGVSDYFIPYLKSQGHKSHLISFRGERINVIFVMGGAAYFHREHILVFKDKYCITDNKLLNAIKDLENPVFQAGLRSIGIIGKLITGPLVRLIEDKKGHIFDLNGTWEHTIKKLNEFSLDPSPLFEGIECVLKGKVVKDEVYEELLKPADDELEALTADCLKLLCCACSILLSRQLKDQLPGGLYYEPSKDVLQETAMCPKQNIISERDFSHLDRQLRIKPTASTVAISGLVCFGNNKTAEYLEKVDDSTRQKMIAKAIKEAPKRRKDFQRKRKEIAEGKIRQMEEQKEKKEKQAVAKELLKEQVTSDLVSCGGLWTTNEIMDQNLGNKDEKKKRKDIIIQLRYRRIVLEQKQKLLLQVTSQGKPVPTETLYNNLKLLIESREESPAEAPANDQVRNKITKEDRQAQITETIKRKSSDSADSAISPNKTTLPELVKKTILHKWETEEEGERWCKGKVLKALDDISSVGCLFTVEYQDGTFDVPLYEDFQKGDLVIMNQWYSNVDYVKI